MTRRIRRWLWLAFLTGALIRAGVFWQTRTLGAEIRDEQQYLQLASNIFDGNGFGWSPGQQTSIRPPLFPAMVAGIWTIAGKGNLQAVRLVHLLLALVTTVLVYQIGRHAFSEAVGWSAAAISWLYPSLIFFNFMVLTETLFTLLLVVFLFLAVRLVQHPSVWMALTSGLALGLATLTRSILWPLPALLCPLLLVLIARPLRTRLVYSALVLAGFVTVITPWAVRNTRLQGVVTIVDTMGGINLRMGNYEHTLEDRMWDTVALQGEKSWLYGIGEEYSREPTEGEKDKWAQRQAFAYMRAHPGTTLRRSLIRFADFWGLEREFIAGVQQGLFPAAWWIAAPAGVVIVLGYVAVALLGGAGLWLAPPERRAHLLLLVPTALITAIHSLVFGHSRYHIPLIPILGLYGSAFVISRLRGSARVQGPAGLAAAATVGILLFIWARQILFVDAARIQRLFGSYF